MVMLQHMAAAKPLIPFPSRQPKQCVLSYVSSAVRPRVLRKPTSLSSPQSPQECLVFLHHPMIDPWSHRPHTEHTMALECYIYNGQRGSLGMLYSRTLLTVSSTHAYCNVFTGRQSSILICLALLIYLILMLSHQGGRFSSPS